MGVDVAAAFAGRRRVVRARATACSATICSRSAAEGPEERLRETQLQPAGDLRDQPRARRRGRRPSSQPVVSAGHSFGEYCSLVDRRTRWSSRRRCASSTSAGKRCSTPPSSRRRRCRRCSAWMRSACAQSPTDVATRARAACSWQISTRPTQIVISGDLTTPCRPPANAMLEAGAKRVVPLNVSGAWHSDADGAGASNVSPRAVENAPFAMPDIRRRFRTSTRSPYRDVATIKQNLVRSIDHEVRWHEPAERLLSYGLDCVVEFGASGGARAADEALAECARRSWSWATTPA